MSRLNRTLRGVPGASGGHHVPGVREGVRDLGAYLREQRQNAQLSVRQLSKAAGISNPYLSQIERGLRRPSADILQALAKGLEVSAESLYVQAGLLDMPDEHAGADEPEGGASRYPHGDARAAIAADPRLNARQRQLLIDLYDSFVEPEAQTLDEFIDATLEHRGGPDEAASDTTPDSEPAAPRPEQGEPT